MPELAIVATKKREVKPRSLSMSPACTRGESSVVLGTEDGDTMTLICLKSHLFFYMLVVVVGVRAWICSMIGYYIVDVTCRQRSAGPMTVFETRRLRVLSWY